VAGHDKRQQGGEADGLVKLTLSAFEHRPVLKWHRFDLNGERGDELAGILGPNALGEGENGNFEVNLQDGLVRDWGSTGYEGDVIDVVQDTQRLGFQEALQRIAKEVGLDPDSLQSNSYRSDSQQSDSYRSDSSRGGSRSVVMSFTRCTLTPSIIICISVVTSDFSDRSCRWKRLGW
jgi:hypothetical protein